MKKDSISNVLRFLKKLSQAFNNKKYFRIILDKLDIKKKTANEIHLICTTPELAFKYILKEEIKPRNMIFISGSMP